MKEVIEKETKSEKKNLNEVLGISKKILKIVYIFAIIILIYACTLILKEWGILSFIFTILKIIAPFFIGLVIAWLFEPIVSYLQKKKVNRILGTSLVYVVLIALLYLIFNSLIPILFSQVNEFIQALPSILDNVVGWFNGLFNGAKSTDIINFASVKTEIINVVKTFLTDITTKLPTTLIDLVKSTFSAFGTFVLGLMIGFYLLFDFDNSEKLVFNLIPKRFRSDARSLLDEINTSLLGFVKGTLITSTLIFILSSIIFAAIGLKAPLLFGLICGVTNIIPYVGPYIGAAPAIIVGFSQGTGVGIAVSVLLLLIQTIEGNLIHPLVMSKAMKLHPVTILISLLIFEHFFGIVGMIVAAPLVAIAKLLILFFKDKYYEKIKNHFVG